MVLAVGVGVIREEAAVLTVGLVTKLETGLFKASELGEKGEIICSLGCSLCACVIVVGRAVWAEFKAGIAASGVAGDEDAWRTCNVSATDTAGTSSVVLAKEVIIAGSGTTVAEGVVYC